MNGAYMELKRFTDILETVLDVKEINSLFLPDRSATEKILRQLRPEGIVDGNRFKLASLEGGMGKSFDFNFQNHHWGDWSKANAQGGKGLIEFVAGTLRSTTAQAVQWLVDEKFLDLKDAKKTLKDAQGDPLVFPIPEEQVEWEAVRESHCIRKDRGIIKNRWRVLDTDGSTLGWKYRIDDRRTSKEVYVLTYRAESGWVKKAWDKKLVPAYGLEKLSRGPTIRVLFVEGESAADKAQEIFGDQWKVLSYSGVTGASKMWLPDDDLWTDTEVVIWPDNDVAGRDSARQVQLLFQTMENKPREIRIVRVENFPSLPPRWDLADWDEDCPIDPLVELERAELVDSFERVMREWVYVSQTDSFYNMVDRALIWSPTAFDRTFTRYKEKSNPPSMKFLSDLGSSRVDDLDFVPGEETILKAPNGKSFLNEWYPSPVLVEGLSIANNRHVSDEEIAENAKYFIAHLDRVCKGEIAEPEPNFGGEGYIEGSENRPVVDALTWHFSEMLRRPMDKRGWIIMLVSKQNGTGKSYFLDVFKELFGHKRALTISVKHFLGDFQDWEDGTLFYELGEAKSQDDTAVYEELKKRHSYKPFNPSKLSDRTVGAKNLNIKTKSQKSQRDFLNCMVTANDLFPLALANNSGEEGSDRRLLVLNPTEILTEEETVQMFDEELRNRAGWIAAYLLRFRAKHHWNPSWAPITAHKRLMMEKDRSRSENRSDKFELGRFDEFFHMLKWAMSEKIGALRRKVFTAEQIRGIAEANRIKFPYDTVKFESILLKAGIITGPSIKMDGVAKKLYTPDKEMLETPVSNWKVELNSSLDSEVI